MFLFSDKIPASAYGDIKFKMSDTDHTEEFAFANDMEEQDYFDIKTPEIDQQYPVCDSRGRVLNPKASKNSPDGRKRNLAQAAYVLEKYSCQICGKKNSRKSHLDRHMRTHTGEKPYSCDVCGLSFSVNSTLKTHYRLHTGEKPFSCAICGTSYTSMAARNSHYITCGFKASRLKRKAKRTWENGITHCCLHWIIIVEIVTWKDTYS